MNTQKYVAYYRVSTKKQGKSGLGLESQKSQVLAFVKMKQGELIGEFTDVQSGKFDESVRTELKKAINLAGKEKATLIVAKQDRLGRDVSHINSLLKGKVQFISLDNLQGSGNELYALMLGVFAQVERKVINERTKKAIEVRRQRGDFSGENVNKLLANFGGENKMKEGREKGLVSMKESAKKRNEKVVSMINGLLKGNQNISYREIANKLNEFGETLPLSKKPYDVSSVARLYNKYIKGKNEYVKLDVSKGTTREQVKRDLKAFCKEMHAKGYKYSYIAKHLNNNKITTANGNKFYSQTIKRLIHE